MKKLNLKPNAFNNGGVLTRAQLKKVMGGDETATGGSGGSSPKVKACEGKSLNNACSWTYLGVTYDGKCLQFGVSPLACSTLG